MEIAKEFNITRNGYTEVNDNVVKSDGFLLKDIETTLTPDNMRTFLVSEETDANVLLGMVAERLAPKPVVEVSEPKPIPVNVNITMNNGKVEAVTATNEAPIIDAVPDVQETTEPVTSSPTPDVKAKKTSKN